MTHPLVTEARKHCGVPYVYGGKGDRVFDLERLALEPSHWDNQLVLDCSGLVTFALYRLGGPDWCGTHNAAALEKECTPVPPGSEREGDLLFRPEHVAIFVKYSTKQGHLVVIEAAGGKKSTRSPAAAAKTDAFVKEHPVLASNFVTAGRLPPSLFNLKGVSNVSNGATR